MNWELRHVDDVEAALDDSGVYVVIHRIETPETHKEYSGVRVSVRADLMVSANGGEGGTQDEPIVSFQGTAAAVRKALARFIEESGQVFPITYEHASYIGYELLRAESTPDYVQD